MVAESLALLELGSHVNVQSLVKHMPAELVQQFERDLSRLDRKEIVTLSSDEKHVVHATLGLHNQEIVRQCAMLEGMDPEWTPNLRELVMRKKRGPQRPRVYLTGRELALHLVRERNEWWGLTA